MDKFLEKWVVSDFILGDAAYFQYHYQGSEEAVPQEDIAAAVSVSRVTVSRVLGEFTSQNMVSLGYRTVTVLDREGLYEMINLEG
jgi:CRP-like cAMP-binding protein